MREWLAMGGYGWFVWPAYLLTAAVLLLNLWWPLRSYRKLRRGLTGNPDTAMPETTDHQRRDG